MEEAILQEEVKTSTVQLWERNLSLFQNTLLQNDLILP